PCSSVPPVLHPFPTRRSSDLRPRPRPRLARDPPPPARLRSHEADLSLPGPRFPPHRRAWPGCPETADVSSERGNAVGRLPEIAADRKSTRLNSSHQIISYAVF